jgi:hypothetical protein
MVSTYCVTFRIGDVTVGGMTYADRRLKLLDNIRSKGMGYWEETTSFALVESSLDTPSFAAKACEGLSRNADMVVVFDPSDMSACYFGPIKHEDVLRSFFPDLKKAA